VSDEFRHDRACRLAVLAGELPVEEASIGRDEAALAAECGVERGHDQDGERLAETCAAFDGGDAPRRQGIDPPDGGDGEKLGVPHLMWIDGIAGHDLRERSVHGEDAVDDAFGVGDPFGEGDRHRVLPKP
jgi:hypothetical protein